MTWLILGAGRSGLAAARLLRTKHPNDSIFLFDDYRDKLAQTKLKRLDELKTQLLSKKKAIGLYRVKIKNLVLSPGISLEHELIKKARQEGLIVLSEVELALKFWRKKIVAVSGTNGKSTTVEMIAHLLNKASYPAKACGNIGTPLSDVVLESKKLSCLVLELSSYQLELIKSLEADLVILLKITPDHLERHKSFANYFHIKWRLLELLKPHGTALLEKETATLGNKYQLKFNSQTTLLVSHKEEEKIKERLPLSLQESPHLTTNASFAVLACQKLVPTTSLRQLCESLLSYQGLCYRFEKIGTISGFAVINDSKATNIDSTIAALLSIKTPCILFLGGVAKDKNFHLLKSYKNKIKKIICFGKAAANIKQELSEDFPLQHFLNLSEAMLNFKKEKTVTLFSPGCASFDEFKDFEERGQFFSNKIKPLLDKKICP